MWRRKTRQTLTPEEEYIKQLNDEAEWRDAHPPPRSFEGFDLLYKNTHPLNQIQAGQIRADMIKAGSITSGKIMVLPEGMTITPKEQ